MAGKRVTPLRDFFANQVGNISTGVDQLNISGRRSNEYAVNSDVMPKVSGPCFAPLHPPLNAHPGLPSESPAL